MKTDVSHLVRTLYGGTSRDFYTLDVELFWLYSVCATEQRSQAWTGLRPQCCIQILLSKFEKKNLYLRHFKVCFGDPERTRGQKAAESVCFVKYLCTCDQLLQLWSLVFHSGRSELSSASRCRIHTKTQLKIGMLSREKSLICSYFTN